jgi:DNA-binding XRE family transcriptional regulator
MSTLRELIDQYHARQAARSAPLTGDAGAGTSDVVSTNCEASENLVLSSAPASPPLSFGELLCLYRKRANVLQWVLAQEIGVSQSYLSKLEAGSTQIPMHVAFRISDALDLSPAQRALLLSAAGYGSAFRRVS